MKYIYPVNYISITQGHHNGLALDFGWCSHHNQDILSIGDGKVHKVEKQKTGGNVIFIYYPDTSYVACYGHLKDIIVKQGQSVKKGQVIGHMGKTGRVSAEHLHFQITSKGKNIYGKGNIDPFKVCFVAQNQDASKVNAKYLNNIKYIEDKKEFDVGDYTLLYDKDLRINHSLINTSIKVKNCDTFTRQFLTSNKLNDTAKMRKNTAFKVRDIYKEKNGRIWGYWYKYWIVICNQDGTPQAKKI